jgi:FtsH-binding integral membrane protein
LGYSIAGLVLFAGLTTFDFQRLRQSTDLDVLNVFLQLLTRNDQS